MKHNSSEQENPWVIYYSMVVWDLEKEVLHLLHTNRSVHFVQGDGEADYVGDIEKKSSEKARFSL